MRSLPTGPDLLVGVAEFLRSVAKPDSFHIHVACNALAVTDREMRKRALVDEKIAQRLSIFLGMSGDAASLERELCHRIAKGEIDLKSPGLSDHLWAIVRAELEIDQPKYATLLYMEGNS